jgi:hypothetical protein
MADIAADSNSSPDVVHAALPKWYKILVCLGSAMVGGFFGYIYGPVGVVSGAAGGVGVAIFWLKRISRFRTQSVTAAIFGGIGWGIVAGLIDTVWLHATILAILFSQVDFRYWDIVLLIAFICGVGAGAVYGLVCMIVLEIHRANKRRGRA